MVSLKLYQFISIKEPLFHTLKSKRVIPLLLISLWASDSIHWNGDERAYHLHFYTSLKTLFFSHACSPTQLNCPLSLVAWAGRRPLPKRLADNPLEVLSSLLWGWLRCVLFPTPPPSPSRIRFLKAAAVSLSPLCSSQQPAWPYCLCGWPHSDCVWQSSELGFWRRWTQQILSQVK